MHAPRVLTNSSDTPDPFLLLPLRSSPWGPGSVEVLPAALLPEQFHDAPQALYQKRGEAALMRAVLEDALACFQNQCGASGVRAQRLAKEAEEWLFSDETVWPFAFVNICEALGLEPTALRRTLRQWRQRPGSPRVSKRRRRSVPARHPLHLAA
jgi:hypothetical protein